MMSLLVIMTRTTTTTMMMMMMIASVRAYSVTSVALTEVPWTLIGASTRQADSVLFESRSLVIVEGDEVQMSCPGVYSISVSFTWHYLNRSSGWVSVIGSTKTLPKKIVTREDSGQYNCSVTVFGRLHSVFSTELTVVEKLSSPLVVTSSSGSVMLEGSGHVTLTCMTSSGPSSNISWSWYRLGEAGLRKVRAEQELRLERTWDSGEYLCRAHADTLGIVQECDSTLHQVVIIPSPAGLPVGIAALVLVLLCLMLLILVVVWLFIHREMKTAALDRLANGSPAKGLPGPGMELKEDSKPIDDEVYMNCEASGEGYSDLIRDEFSEENTYDCLS